MTEQWPSRGSDVAGIPMGVNVMDDLAVMDVRYAQKLDNMEYRKGTIVRRGPFVAKSTELLPSEASFGIEYIDTAGNFRILWGSMDGKVKEFLTSTSHADRVTGLTAARRAYLAQMLGAAFHQNGEDTPRRGDGATWRVAGAPLPMTDLDFDGIGWAGSLSGDYIWMVTACIHDGVRVILESDHSNYVDATLGGESKGLEWAPHADTRVNWYRVYRVKEGQGSPLFLEAEGSSTYFTDLAIANGLPAGSLGWVSSMADADLSEQTAAPLERNGPMPVAAIVVQAGQRLVCAKLIDVTDANAHKAVHVSIIATNPWEMEYFPTDDVHRFYLPGAGEVTAAFGYSVKDEDLAARDLFLSQRTSCYILRGADPFGVLEPISYTKGVVSDRAVTQWGRFLFMVTNEGLEFLGPEGEPQLISPHVNAFFFGGGTLRLTANTGPEMIHLSIDRGRLLVCLRDDTDYAWGNKSLVLDLERFNPYDAKAWRGAFYTLWNGRGLGMAFFLPTRDGELLLFDNQNRRLLQRSGTGYADTVNGVSQLIPGRIWTAGLMASFMTFLKVLRQLNILQQSDADTTVDVLGDYGASSALNKTVPRATNTRTWNKTWNKAWANSVVFLSSLFIRRDVKGRLFQVKLTIENASPSYTYIGLQAFFTAVKAKRLTKR